MVVAIARIDEEVMEGCDSGKWAGSRGATAGEYDIEKWLTANVAWRTVVSN
jgi:hypothetical protein